MIYDEERPWGYFKTLKESADPIYKVKQIMIKPDQRLSYQYHEHRDEIWTVLDGSGIAVLDGLEHKLKKYTVLRVPRLMKHRIYNSGNKPLIVHEVQTGDACLESDIIRIEDDYGRKGENK